MEENEKKTDSGKERRIQYILERNKYVRVRREGKRYEKNIIDKCKK